MTHFGTFGAEEGLDALRHTRPRTFKEVVAAQDPTEMARLAVCANVPRNRGNASGH